VLEPDSDLPLLSKETITLESHRPLTFESQNCKNSNNDASTKNMEEFVARESLGVEREDRIRSIQLLEDADLGRQAKHASNPALVARNGKVSG